MALFDAHITSSNSGAFFQYDVTADGKRFLIATAVGSGAASTPLTVVTNWQAGVKK
jgi:hypothetical protein